MRPLLPSPSSLPSCARPDLTHSLARAQTSFLRALPSFVPVHLFPAMNTHMYAHPLTAKQLAVVQDELGYKVHGPVGKKLACGDIGALSCSLSRRQPLREAHADDGKVQGSAP